MIIKILNCMPDGTQELIEKEVPEDYFGTASSEDEATAESKNEQTQTPESTAQ